MSGTRVGAVGYILATIVLEDVHASEKHVDPQGIWNPVVSWHTPYGAFVLSTSTSRQPYQVVVESVNPELKVHAEAYAELKVHVGVLLNVPSLQVKGPDNVYPSLHAIVQLSP